MIAWVSGPRSLTCRVCGAREGASLVARVTAFHEVGLEAVRCGACGSIQLTEHPRDFAPTTAAIDSYVESGAGIGAIAEVFAGIGQRPGIRFLDVGCSYPFALDLARLLFDWEVLGVEPSPAGERGGRELKVEVLSDFLTPESQLGDGFDVVLASEVIEHVTDPLTFLSTIRSHLTPTGVLVMTTPAAEIVDAAEPENEVLLALSPGYHVFLASVPGMQLLLTKAGFASHSVIRERGTLRITARIGPDTANPDDATGSHPVSLDDLEHYYAWRGERAPVSTPLALGLATRLFRLRVARGDFRGATAALPRMVRATRAVHGVDLRRPQSAAVRAALVRTAPISSIGATFALGMFELLHRGRARRAAAYFELSELVCDRVLATSNIIDGDSADLRFEAPFHRALALARFDPDAAAALALDLASSLDPNRFRAGDFLVSRQCRVYTELVAAGAHSVAPGLTDLVAEHAAILAADSDPVFRTAGLDALFSLGMAALLTAQPALAVQRLAACADLLRVGPTTDHATALLRNTERHLATARAQADARMSATPTRRPGLR
jgi:SAM-dependent methyltransferase